MATERVKPLVAGQSSVVQEFQIIFTASSLRRIFHFNSATSKKKNNLNMEKRLPTFLLLMFFSTSVFPMLIYICWCFATTGDCFIMPVLTFSLGLLLLKKIEMTTLVNVLLIISTFICFQITLIEIMCFYFKLRVVDSENSWEISKFGKEIHILWKFVAILNADHQLVM